jgi:hypothetical protein
MQTTNTLITNGIKTVYVLKENEIAVFKSIVFL